MRAQTDSVVTAIGAQSTYQECPTGPYAKIVATGDEARSFLPALESVVQSGINVLIWAGDLGMYPESCPGILFSADTETH